MSDRVSSRSAGADENRIARSAGLRHQDAYDPTTPKGRPHDTVHNLLAFALDACGYEAFSGAEETDAILTIREPNRDFTVLESFVLPDEVFDLSDLVTDPRERDESKDELILDEIAEGLTELGWRRLAEGGTEEPDVVVLAGAVAQDN